MAKTGVSDEAAHNPGSLIGEPRRVPGTGPAGSEALVSRAEGLLRVGRLAEAEGVLNGVLAFSPRVHAALHLLALIAWQKGEQTRSIDLYRQAISINGKVAAYHGNLGNAYFETGDMAEAARCYRRVLALEPCSAQARFALGITLLTQNDFAAAATVLLAAAKLQPDHADTHLNLGIALTKLGESEKAVAHCRRSIALDPGYGAAHLRLAIALRLNGQPEATHEPIVCAVEIAEADYRRAVAMLPLNQSGEETPPRQQATMLVAQVLKRLRESGDLLCEIGEYDAAIACYERASALNPRSGTLLHAIGQAQIPQGRLPEARAAFLRAIELQPDNPDHYAQIGRTYQFEGRFEEANGWFEKALARRPDHPDTHLNLALMKDAADREGRIRQLEQSLSEGPEDPGRRAGINFALAKLHEEGGDHDRAFLCVTIGNDFKKRQYPFRSADFTAAVDRIIAEFSRELFAAKAGIGSDSDRPVFVVGMPRSGTSLVEQILASHSAVHGHGELQTLHDIADAIAQRIGCGMPYPECIAGLDRAIAGEIARDYLARLEPEAGGIARSVDKMPHNFLHLGLISLLFPRARLIHCRRDPRDTCLSLYFIDFGPRHPFSYDLGQLGRYYRDYERLMAHWHAVLPISILDVPYEALVADQEGWSRQLVDFVGLPWDDRCLAFYETRRPVITSSAWQVRQPIYTSSIGRWRPYEEHLKPLFDSLGIEAPN